MNDLLDSGRGLEHRVGYHKLIIISNRHKWNNCIIKYQTAKHLTFVYVEVLNVNPSEHCDCILLLTASKLSIAVSFYIWTNYRI